MSMRWQTFSFISIHTKHFIPTACHLLHSPHPIPGQPPGVPPVEYSKAGTSRFCFFMLESGDRVRCKKAAGNLDLVSCFIHEIQRTAEPNNHQDYSANQSGIQNYRLPFYLWTLRRFLLIKKQNLLVPACMSSTKRLPLNL